MWCPTGPKPTWQWLQFTTSISKNMQLYSCSVFLLLKITLVPNHTEILNVYLKSRERRKGEREKRIWEISPFATWQRVSSGGWLQCHSFVGAPICLIFHLYSGKQRQTAAAPLLLFLLLLLRVHLRRPARPWATSSGFGEKVRIPVGGTNVPPAYGHVLPPHLSHHPSFHCILNQIPEPPPNSTSWGGLKARV